MGSPNALMAEIDVAISRVECSHSTAERDQFHRLGCKALSAVSFGEPPRCFKSALAWCPPEKRAAVGKHDSLIPFASQETHKSSSPGLKQR